MKALDLKLLRDLWKMKGQALAIALVIAGGVATFIMSASTLDSLRLTRSAFYRDYRFSEVFVSLKRAPEGLKSRIAEIPGVERVETRVVAAASLDIPGFPDPVTGRLVSVPDTGEPILNRLYIRRGRTIEPGRDDEAVVSEAFAKAHSLGPGDHVGAVINGRRKTLRIVGVALTPEYIFQVSPGATFPDFKHFGVFWMGRTPLGNAYNMDGAFNDIVLTLVPGASEQDVINRLDRILEPYGGLGAYGRKDQTSHFYLSEEFRQLGKMAQIFPIIFLGVASFLLNVVVTRLISTQREEIAVLKAFGYSNRMIALHYIKLVLVIVFIGVAEGIASGVWLGKSLSGLYMRFYRFPFLEYDLSLLVVLTAAMVSAAAAVAGTVFAVRRAAVLSPAEAMRPEPPASYHETFVERIGLKRFFSQPSRMIMRHLERRPVKASLTVLGIALACATMVAGSFFGDAINYMVDIQFNLAAREDMTVTFTDPASMGSLQDIRSLRGVHYAEPFRSVPARLRFEHRSYRTALMGLDPNGDLERLLDQSQKPVRLPSEGVVMPAYLGKLLGVKPGDRLTVEVLEGKRPVREVPVAALVNQYIGMAAYMDIRALNRLMREGGSISGVNLAVDSEYKDEIYDTLKGMPRVAGTAARKDSLRNFYDTMAEQILIFTFFTTALASTIAFGVVYNSARIALSERGRELASLRVLGFTRGEISYILLGELGLLTLVSIPLGFLIGRGISAYMIKSLQTDLFRVPLVIEAKTYAFAAVVVLVSAFVSGLIIRDRLNRLDLVAVLKTRE